MLISLILFRKSVINYSSSFRKFNSKVPKQPHNTINNKTAGNSVKVDLITIAHLEKLSLVNFENLKGIEILESSVRFAEQLLTVDTKGVKPLTTVLENRTLSLRDDKVTDGNCRDAVMANAKVTEEEYFVAPPGNIPLEPKSQDIFKEQIKKEN